MTTTFIGGGNMATALIGGMRARGTAVAELRVVEPVDEARAKLDALHPGLALYGEITHDAVAGSTLVVVAVKPQHVRAAASALAPHLATGGRPVVLSIAAGIRLADIGRWLGGYARIVRAMPNTPALIGRGISGIYAPPAVDAAARALASAVIGAVGDEVWVESEAMIDAVTGLSGSGPAYVFYFLEALEEAGCRLGFPAPDARRLAYATFAGAIALAQTSPDEPATLRAKVTSKGGTTERAIATMDERGVKAAILAAVRAAALRAAELGDDLGRES